mmetsp:Transcript_11317/g.18330  ORF Transcript_11317/g.18330 Transcript_11317/m.18330 type:complete len:171 (+) Transcript_11317:1653-2165(+)
MMTKKNKGKKQKVNKKEIVLEEGKKQKVVVLREAELDRGQKGRNVYDRAKNAAHKIYEFSKPIATKTYEYGNAAFNYSAPIAYEYGKRGATMALKFAQTVKNKAKEKAIDTLCDVGRCIEKIEKNNEMIVFPVAHNAKRKQKCTVGFIGISRNKQQTLRCDTRTRKWRSM